MGYTATMLLNKTDKARTALKDGRGTGLSLEERRILILTDGKRTLNEVMGLLGPGILPAVDRLGQHGYISDASAPPTSAALGTRQQSLGGAMSSLIRAATEAVQAHTIQVRTTTPVAAAPTSAPLQEAPGPPISSMPAPLVSTTPPPISGTRRSLAASKMYMLDMLQLQRNVEAVELRTEIQCTVGTDALIDVLLRGLRVVQQCSPASYSQRVAARLSETLPEEALARLEAVGNEASAAPALRIVG